MWAITGKYIHLIKHMLLPFGNSISWSVECIAFFKYSNYICSTSINKRRGAKCHRTKQIEVGLPRVALFAMHF
jgi:hypothetical protein